MPIASVNMVPGCITPVMVVCRAAEAASLVFGVGQNSACASSGTCRLPFGVAPFASTVAREVFLPPLGVFGVIHRSV